MNKIKIISFMYLIIVFIIVLVILLFKYSFGNQETHTTPESFSGGFPQNYKVTISTNNEISCDILSWSNKVILTSTAEELYFSDANSGSLITRRDISNTPANCPLIVGEWVIVPYINGGLQVITIKNFKTVWEDSYSSNLTPSSISNLVLYNNLLLVLRYSKHLVAYDINTGNIVWETEVKNKYMSISASNNFFYLSNDKNIFVYDIKTGVEINTYQLTDYILGEIVFANPNEILIENYQSYYGFLIYDINKKSVIDEIRLEGINNTQQFIQYNNILYIIGDDLIAYNLKSKEILWSLKSKDSKFVCISFSGKDIFITDLLDTIYIVDEIEGKIKGSMKINLNNCPITTRHALFVPSNNELYMFTLGD